MVLAFYLYYVFLLLFFFNSLVRTPPKKFKPFAADPSSRVSQAPQPSSPSSRIQRVQEPPQASEKRKHHNEDDPIQVNPKYQEEPRAVKSEPNLSPKPPEPSDVTPSYHTPHHKPSHPSAQPISHPPQRKAPAAKNPSRAMIEDFALPKPRVCVFFLARPTDIRICSLMWITSVH